MSPIGHLKLRTITTWMKKTSNTVLRNILSLSMTINV